ncbi:hypothetical protein EV426DRAFT_392980 [Tirmania nivea]|nr:hypothetical protein EV426DRAFT_392980 [Tirmania nivea]
MSPPLPVQKGSKTSSCGPSPSKRQFLRDALLNFGKPNYAPLTPIEILPGIMSTDGVATVFQLDTRKPKTKRQVERMEEKKKKRSTSVAARDRQMREVARGEWQNALRPGLQEGYFGSGSGAAVSERTQKDPNKPSVRKSLMRSLPDDGTDEFTYEQMLKLKGFKRKDKGKDLEATSKLGPPYPTLTKPISPTDKLMVRHANPFTGLLSRNQTQLNVSKFDDVYPPGWRKQLGPEMTGGLPLSPSYPHSRYSYPAVSSPSLSGSTAAAFEDLIPMPSVNEPAPFSFPGATAEGIAAYERALQLAASSVAENLTVPQSRKLSAVQHLSENEKSASKGRGDHFLALDGGLEQQAEQERRTKHKKAPSSTRTSSLQDRHLQTPELQNLSTTPPPLPRLPCRGPAPLPEDLLQSASNMDHRLHRHRRERRTSTSISTMRGKGDTLMLQLEGEENRISAAHTPQHRRMERVNSLIPKAGRVTGAAAKTGVRERREESRMPKRVGPGTGLALFNMSVPFIDPRELADYRRTRAGLPPLREKEGWVKQRVEFPFNFGFNSPSSTSVSESECEYAWEGQRASSGALTKVKEGKAAKIKDTKAAKKAEHSGKPSTAKTGLGKDYSFKSVLTQLLKSLQLVPPTFDLSLPLAMKEAIGIVMAFLEPVLTLNAPSQFWKLPILLRVLFGMWYFVIVTWGVLVVVKVVRIIGAVVGLVMVPVRGVVWVAKVICGG